MVTIVAVYVEKLDAYSVTLQYSVGGHVILGYDSTVIEVPSTVMIPAGTLVQFSVLPDAGYQFVDFKVNDVSQNVPFNYTLDRELTVVANFTLIPTQYILTLSAGLGGTTVPSPNAYPHDVNAKVECVALPDIANNYRFLNWLLDGNNIGNNPYTVTMNDNHTLEAVFELGEPGDSTISGFIRDVQNQPIVGATVTAGGYAYITQVDGSYIFQNIPAQPYTLTITKTGYQTTSIALDTTQGGIFQLDIMMSSPPSTNLLAAILALGGVAGITYTAIA